MDIKMIEVEHMEHEYIEENAQSEELEHLKELDCLERK